MVMVMLVMVVRPMRRCVVMSVLMTVMPKFRLVEQKEKYQADQKHGKQGLCGHP
jgi:hypothetical protein